MKIGSRIQSLRKLASLSQEDVAEQIGVSRQTISKWERDECLPEVDKIVAISQLFDVSMDELLLGKTRQNQNTSLDDLMIRNNQRKTIVAGIKTGIFGTIMLVVSILLTDLWAMIDKNMTSSFYTNHMTYLKHMPLSFIFWLSIITIITGATIAFVGFVKKKSSKQR